MKIFFSPTTEIVLLVSDHLELNCFSKQRVSSVRMGLLESLCMVGGIGSSHPSLASQVASPFRVLSCKVGYKNSPFLFVSED